MCGLHQQRSCCLREWGVQCQLRLLCLLRSLHLPPHQCQVCGPDTRFQHVVWTAQAEGPLSASVEGIDASASPYTCCALSTCLRTRARCAALCCLLHLADLRGGQSTCLPAASSFTTGTCLLGTCSEPPHHPCQAIPCFEQATRHQQRGRELQMLSASRLMHLPQTWPVMLALCATSFSISLLCAGRSAPSPAPTPAAGEPHLTSVRLAHPAFRSNCPAPAPVPSVFWPCSPALHPLHMVFRALTHSALSIMSACSWARPSPLTATRRSRPPTAASCSNPRTSSSPWSPGSCLSAHSCASTHPRSAAGRPNTCACAPSA